MSTKLKVLLLAVVVIIAAAAGGIWWFLRDDAPPEVDLATAVASVTDTTVGAASDGSTATTVAAAATADGIEGTWTIDTSTGEFDFESATGTFAGFRIQEQLTGIGSTTAVGRTGDVTGSITIDGTTLSAADFDVDVTTITTNDSRRNRQVQSALETGQFPTATFSLTQPVDLGAGAATGDSIAVTAVGDLTIHGVTKQVQLPLEAQLVNGTVVVVGSTDIVFSDYGVEVPESQIVVSVEDHGVLELQFLLARA